MSEKIALEVVEKEFERFAAEWDIDSNSAGMSDEDRESFEPHKKRIVRGIQEGYIVIGDDGDPTYTLRKPKGETTTITFYVPSGAAYMEMDKYKDRQLVHKMNAFMGSMTKQAPAFFSNMDGRDLKVCQAVVALFMGS